MTFTSGPLTALGVPGFRTTDVDTVQRLPIGTIVKAVDPTLGEGEFIYLPGVVNCLAGCAVVYDLTPGANVTALTLSGTHLNGGHPLAVAVVAVPAASFGWFQISGVAITAGIAAGIAGKCMLTTTAGALDDTAIAGCQVLGARQLTAFNTPSAGFAYTLLNRPSIQSQIT